MTTSTTATWELNRDELITEGLMLAGALNAAQPASAELVALGKNLLQSSLSAIQSEGIFLRSVDRFSQTLTSGTISYATSADTIDVEPDAIIRTSQNLDIPIRAISREDYQAKSDKTLQNQPTNFYVEQSTGGAITIYMYPSPDATYTLIYPRVRRLKDLSAGTVTMDTSPRWMEALGWMLAWKFSVHLKYSAARCEMLKKYYDEAKFYAMNDETPRGPSKFIFEPMVMRY